MFLRKAAAPFLASLFLATGAMAEEEPLPPLEMPTQPVYATHFYSLGLSEGVLGHTIEGNWRINRFFGVRGLYGSGNLDYSGTQGANSFTGSAKLSGAGLMTDFYVTGNTLRLSAGVLKLKHELSASTGGTTVIGGTSYPVTVTANARFKNDIAPVMAIGFQHHFFEGPVYMSADFGAMYTGGVSLDATDPSGTIPQAAIDAELSGWRNDLANMRIAPFITLGLGMSF